MKRDDKYVALDVHQEATAASVRKGSGKVIARTILPTETAAFVEFFRGMRGSIHVALEEGTQAQWLHDLITPLVTRVIVCDRRGEPRRGSKNDQVDADLLSELLRCGSLRSVYHGNTSTIQLKELTRTYRDLIQDTTRSMLRLKALFRARGIKTRGQGVYHPSERSEWLNQLPNPGARFRAQALWAQIDLMRQLHPKAKQAMLSQARRDPAWPVLLSVPFLGPIRVAMLLATLQSPWRFRTKRNLWAYAGLAVVSHTSAEYVIERGRPVRRPREPMTRGLNRNHNPLVKDIFKGAATAASGRPGPLHDWYQHLLAGGMREPLARVTLARKLAAITLRLWKTGEHFDAACLTIPPR